MHRIDTSTAQIDKFGAGKNGFTNGDPATGRRATDLNSDMWDAVQEEICNLIEKSGVTLDKEQHDQMYQAMVKLIVSKIPDALIRSKNLSDVANKVSALANINGVPQTRKINGKALSADLVLTPADVAALPLAGGTMTGEIAGAYNGSHAWAEQYKTTAPYFHDYTTQGTSEYWPLIKQRARLGSNGWAFSMGTLVSGTTLSFNLHLIGSAGQNFTHSWDTGGNFQCAKQVKPGDWANFDARYQPKGSYTPAGQAYTKAESDGRFNLKNTANKTATGWWRCGSTGLILQWGAVGVGKDLRVTFPITFPSACISIQISQNNSTYGDRSTANISATSKNTSGFTSHVYNNEYGADWLAIGF